MFKKSTLSTLILVSVVGVALASGGPIVVDVAPGGDLGSTDPFYISFDQAIEPTTVDPTTIVVTNNGNPAAVVFGFPDPSTVSVTPATSYAPGAIHVDVTSGVHGTNSLPAEEMMFTKAVFCA